MHANMEALHLLRQIADEVIDYEHFNMNDWAIHEGDHPFPMPLEPAVLRDCGTTGCLLGWALTVEAFRKLVPSLYWRQYSDEEWSVCGGPAKNALGISDDASCLLFFYTTASKACVLARIDYVIKHEGRVDRHEDYEVWYELFRGDA